MTKPKITPNPADPLLSSAQAAVALQCSLRSVQLWCEAGLLAHQSTPGGHRRIATSEVERFQEARKAKVTGLRRLGDEEVERITQKLQMDAAGAGADLVDVIRAVEVEFARLNGLTLAQEPHHG